MAPELNNKRAFRFKPVHDIILLKEVSRVRPWAAAHGETLASWDAIGATFNAQLNVIRPNGPEIDPKACQRRYKALIDAFLSGDLQSLRSTGPPEEVAEREQLIAELHQAAKDYRTERGERRQSRGFEGSEIHETPLPDVSLPALAMASTTQYAIEHPTSAPKRPLEQNGSAVAHAPAAAKKARTLLPAAGDSSSSAAWEFLQRHLETESVHRRQELLLAEQRLDLDKQRFELEKRERESHLSMLSAQLDLIKQLTRQLQHQQ
ncbi:hypothetical protein Poli38472_002534 [Pythium oligandrum]|uniref:Myb-like domain-containing protein n=1 Tax=Pythium oligandrum TaxID=41045 RepID=A0A8K1CJJ4_PYTOL|nr:hypothetical protein Poli38472_002534 [Pythium oligandrum]|eukprot:TMW63593.1 hypothetical protein Poli38472_002534 [Pythium oligandrum]